MKKPSIPFLAFLQATGLVTYLVLFSVFINFVAPNFDETNIKFYGPIIGLLLFIISAVITATITLARAGVLFWEKRYKESFLILAWTVGWGILYFALFIFFLYI